MELRQLQYFVAVAEELSFRRAAERLLIAGPSLSQQIKALERDLGVRLFDRDRRSVTLTPAGAALLPHTRSLLERAEDLRSRAARISGTEPVRLGYVSWLPPDLNARAAAVARLNIDAWVAPSHTQAARVADGSLDLAVCWVNTDDLERHALNARLLGAERLYTVAASKDATPVQARETAVLLDDDATSWQSWNIYAQQIADDTGSRAVHISDGGITGHSFFDHVRRSPRPIINSPKGQTTPLPPDLHQRPLVDPKVYWTWSLVWRRSEHRAAVLATVEALTQDIITAVHAPDAWLPATDPHKI